MQEPARAFRRPPRASSSPAPARAPTAAPARRAAPTAQPAGHRAIAPPATPSTRLPSGRRGASIDSPRQAAGRPRGNSAPPTATCDSSHGTTNTPSGGDAGTDGSGSAARMRSTSRTARVFPRGGQYARRGHERDVRLPTGHAAQSLGRRGDVADQVTGGDLPNAHQLPRSDDEHSWVHDGIGKSAEHDLASFGDAPPHHRRTTLAVRQHEAAGAFGQRPPTPRHLRRLRQCRQRATTRTGVRQPDAYPRPMPDRHHERLGRQLDAFNRHVGDRPLGQDTAAIERDRHRQRRLVDDLHHRDAARVSARVHRVHDVAARHAHSRLGHRRAVHSRLAHRWFVPRYVPAVVGRDVPVERWRAVPRLDPAPRRDRRTPTLPNHACCDQGRASPTRSCSCATSTPSTHRGRCDRRGTPPPPAR